ncbi:MAG TPA: LysM peptidoglycan-binding domain-containing protein [Nitrospirota bacterium]|nr:LysM peptidoglycan-binding domain-containing protein [Nitrospirota bacterium]
MTRRSQTLVHAVTMLLLMTLLPISARSQNQNAVPAPQQEKATEGQTPQKPAEMTIPVQGTITPEPEAAKTAPSPEAAGSYTIKKGDTLWDISNAFLKDPFLWPFIWKENPSITNPDLIYPGNKLTIPSLAPIERAMQTPVAAERQATATTETTEEAGGKGLAALQRNQEMGAGAAPEKPGEAETLTTGKLIVPEEAATPIIDRYTMLSAGYVGNDTSKDVIVGGEEEKNYFGYDDVVYVNIGSKDTVNVGDKYIMFDPLNNVKHPVTGKTYGKLIRILGILQITAKKDASGLYTARITLSFDVSGKGTMLMPYQEPTPVYDNPQTKTKDISGYILEVVESRTVNGQHDIVYLDKGSADGVEPGDRFVVYSGQKKVTYPRSLVGEAQVIIVKEHTSTAVVRKSSDALVKGDQVEFKK